MNRTLGQYAALTASEKQDWGIACEDCGGEGGVPAPGEPCGSAYDAPAFERCESCDGSGLALGVCGDHGPFKGDRCVVCQLIDASEAE